MTEPSLPSQDLINDFVGNAHGNFARVQELLEQYPGILNQSAAWTETAIEAASQTGNLEIINLLLAAGAPTSICTEAVLGHLDKVKAYLDSDPARANATGAHGISALYHAVIRGQAEIAQLLVDRGAEVNADEDGNPPIHGAAMFNQPAMLELLLARGANVNAKNYEGKTPLTVALEGGKAEAVEILRRQGAVE